MEFCEQPAVLQMKNRFSHPLYDDVVQGAGGIADGSFTMNSKDTLSYDPVSNLLGTESNVVITDELEVGLEKNG